MYSYPALSGIGPSFTDGPPLSVFPRYSAQVAKETLAVIGLVLAAVALVMLVTVVAPELFGRAASAVACSTLDLWSHLGPWCSALI